MLFPSLSKTPIEMFGSGFAGGNKSFLEVLNFFGQSLSSKFIGSDNRYHQESLPKRNQQIKNIQKTLATPSENSEEVILAQEWFMGPLRASWNPISEPLSTIRNQIQRQQFRCPEMSLGATFRNLCL